MSYVNDKNVGEFRKYCRSLSI